MYPPEQAPPGVFPSQNHAEVTTPISVAEWFINYYQEHRGRIQNFEEKKKYETERWEFQQKQMKKRKEIMAAKAKEEEEKQTRASKKAKKTAAAASSASSASPAPTPSASASASPPLLSGPVECICEPGEVIFIPNGWWHTALNLTPSFAVTQNYVNEDNVSRQHRKRSHAPRETFEGG